jgi:hypothetical protein
MSAINIGMHFDCRPAEGPKAYDVRSGERWLHNLEDAEIRCWPEHHLILIDERTGHLMIEGGYGTFSYGWPNYGRGERSLHAFLYSLGFDYFMEKASRQPHRVIDVAATVRRLKEEIVEDRRRRDLEKSEARDLWDELESCESEHGRGFVDRLFEDRGWYARLDCSDPSVMVDSPTMRRFWDEVWSPFCEEVLRLHMLDHVKRRPIPRGRALVAVEVKAA